MAYGVAQRMREIGVRMALGAQRGEVMRQVVRRGLALTVIGLAIGLIVATMTMRSVRGLLFGVTPLDPMTFLAAFLLFACVAALASYVPAAARPASIGLSRCATNRRSVSIEPDLPFESSYNPSSSAVTLSPGTRLGVYEIIAFDRDGMSAAPVSHKPEFGIGQPRQLFAIKSRCQAAGRDGTSTQAASAFF